MNLSGKKAVVLGGTSGIGLSTVNKLVAAGASVVAVSRNPERARDAVPAGTELRSCDVRDEAALGALFAECAPFDVLVCVATGGERATGPFLKMDRTAYRNSFDKLWGYTNAVHLGTEHLTETGNIVLVSGAPARRARPGSSAIASVGGAVEQFCRAVATEMAPRRINVVSPGIIDTPMFGPDADARADMLGKATARHLVPRPGTPDEVADGIMFVVQNDFVTGTTIDVDGGWLLT